MSIEKVLGKLKFTQVNEKLELLSESVKVGLLLPELGQQLDSIYSVEIDPTLADTAEFCAHYEILPEVSANTIVVQAKRGERKWFALCVILATTRADINKVVRKHLDAKSVSFAPMDLAVELTSMEYGGIGPIGVPSDWPILIDSRVKDVDLAIVGSGKRGSKVALPGEVIGELPNALFIEDLANLVTTE